MKIRNFISYGIDAIFIAIAICLIANPAACLKIQAWARESSNITNAKESERVYGVIEVHSFKCI